MSEEVSLGAQLIRAAKLREDEADHLYALIDRMISTGIEHFDSIVSSDDVRSIPAWLGLSEEEYAAWREGGANGLALFLMQDTHTIRIPKPVCPTCGQSSVSTAYTSTWHEHTCANGHTWRIN